MADSLPYPDDVCRVLEFLESHGIYGFLVGGAVRDFLLTKKLGDDLDFELHGKLEEWEDISWEEFDSVKVLHYGVRQVRVGSRVFDLAPARLESYFLEEEGHSNFKVTFIPFYDFKKSFRRRDFTVNAIAYDHREGGGWIDPFCGQKDLEEKILRPCSQDFPRDPVRYLRAIRFMAMGFYPSLELKTFLEKMSLRKLSLHYFLRELLKAKDQHFFIAKCPEFNPSLPRELGDLCRVLARWSSSFWESEEHILYHYILGGGELLEWGERGIVKYFKLLKRVSLEEWRELSGLSYEDFKQSPQVKDYLKLVRHPREFSFLTPDHHALLKSLKGLGDELGSCDLDGVSEAERGFYQLYCALSKK